MKDFMHSPMKAPVRAFYVFKRNITWLMALASLLLWLNTENLSAAGPAMNSIDLELTMTVNNNNPLIYTDVIFTATLVNKGPMAATGVAVSFPMPQNMAHTAHSSTLGNYDLALEKWTVGTLPANGAATLKMTLFTLTNYPMTAFTQVKQANEPDADSTPGNGTCCTANEDDEAVLVISNGVPVCSGTFYLTSQADVDNWPGCTVWDGNLLIGPSPGDITDLSPLITLQEVTGGFGISYANYLSDLDGLENLTTVGGSFSVGHCDQLTDISALNNLTTVGGSFSLSSLSGSINSLEPFSNLQSIGDGLFLSDVPGITSLSPIKNAVCAGSILIYTMHGLQSLDDLPYFTSVKDISLYYNASLQNVDALSYITQISGNLDMYGNGSLDDCCGLHPLLENDGVGGTIKIVNNPSPCDNLQNLLDVCGTGGPSQFIDLELDMSASQNVATQGDVVTFTIKVDNKGSSNASGVTVKDVLPPGLNFASATATIGNYNAANGIWTIGNLVILQSATLTLQANVGNLTAAVTNFAQVQTASPNDDPDSTPGNDFNNTANEDDEDGVTISPAGTGYVDIEVSIAANNYSPPIYSYVTFTINVFNNSAFDATFLKLDLPLPATLVMTGQSSVSQGVYDAFNHVWNIGTLLPAQTATMNITLFTLSGNQSFFFVQLWECMQEDSDSYPSNGVCCTPQEDDEAVVVLNATTRAAADLELSIFPFNYVGAVPGDVLSFTYTLSNEGIETANNTQVEVVLPTGFTLGQTTPSTGTVNGLIWTVPSLAILNSATLQITVNVVDFPLGVQFKYVQGQVKSTGQPDPDSTPGNLGTEAFEDDEAQCYVNNGAAGVYNWTITVTAYQNSGLDPSSQNFTVTLKNIGTIASPPNATVYLTYSSQLQLANALTMNGLYDYANKQWKNIGALQPGESATLSLITNASTMSFPLEVCASMPGNPVGGGFEVCKAVNFIADLSVTGEVLTDAVVGQLFHARVTVSNDGEVGSGYTKVRISLYNIEVTSVSQGYISPAGEWLLEGGVSPGYDRTIDLYGVPVATGNSGLYAEITYASVDDPDSTPGNGFYNDEDDYYAQPFTILPSTSSGMDLELLLTAQETSFKIYTDVHYTLTITNAGTSSATDIKVNFPMPPGMVYTSSSATVGGFWGGWNIPVMDPGVTHTLNVALFVLDDSQPITAWAQVTAAFPTDVDSSPGNAICCVANEDDEAALTLPLFSNAILLKSPDMKGRPVLVEKITPNPVYFGFMTVTIHSQEAGNFPLVIYDLFGRQGLRQTIELQKGPNEVFLDVSNLESGMYHLDLPGYNLRYMPVRFTVQRW
ncbi:MAG: hypothetical protein R2830_19255 [Saprospiraceae bacterium]